ncbi:MFS transporter [Microbacterium profundi]|uniref:MFS transporter n=1 Tax=Microbacterium profundi TaxID=450380 RepID=UPI00051A5295|nr:MFS transporter [Microbacterium profundi]
MSRRSIPWLVVAGVLVAALSLRAPIIAVTPVLPDIVRDLGIGAASAGLLTMAPVIMFAAITPVAALLIRRAGAELALLLSLSGVLFGTFVRALPGYGSMLAGMFIIGAAITIGNVVVPVIIRRDLPPERTAVATAAYSATLNVGSLVTALGTVPLAELMGWPLALLVWSSVTVVGLALWIVHIVRSKSWRSAERASGEAGKRESGDTGENITGPLPVIVDNRVAAIVRRPIVWMLFAAFGMQSAIYYGMSTWLPTMLIDTTGTDAATAGALASLFQGVAIVGALLAPVLLKYLGAVPAGVLMGACFGTMVIGMLFAPEVAAVWASFGAIAHSSGFVLIFTAMVRVSRSDAEAATMSALVQGGGYVLAALGAPLLGALNEISGGWQVPMLAVIAATAVYSTALVSAMFVALRRG